MYVRYVSFFSKISRSRKIRRIESVFQDKTNRRRVFSTSEETRETKYTTFGFGEETISCAIARSYNSGIAVVKESSVSFPSCRTIVPSCFVGKLSATKRIDKIAGEKWK